MYKMNSEIYEKYETEKCILKSRLKLKCGHFIIIVKYRILLFHYN